jgi:hypothetical protein
MIIELNWESVCLEDIFGDIIYTKENPLIVKTESIFKEGDKIKRVRKEEKFDLTKKDILSELLNNGKKEDIHFFQTGILKLFKKTNKNQIIKYLYNLSKDNWIIMGRDVRKILDISQTPCNLVVDNRVDNKYIIIGNRNSRCIINKDTNEYYIDTTDVSVLCLV